MPGDTGFFQINSERLHIPPEQIQVDRQSANNRWQTLRTTSSIKAKSGYSVVNIVVKATFTSEHGVDDTKPYNGIQQLRNVIAQLRVTPFCYVENRMIRNAMLGGSSTPSMVLAIRQIQIMKRDDSVDKIDVVFYFSWFNYFPYLREWLYKKDFNLPTPVTDPAKSVPWEAMWKAEILRRGGQAYADVRSLNQASAQMTWMEYPQYATIKVSKYKTLEEDVQALHALASEADSLVSSQTNAATVNSAVAQFLIKARGPAAGASLNENIFGGTTSQMPPGEGMTADQIANLIQKNISPDSGTPFALVDKTNWQPVVNRKAKAVLYKSLPQAQRRETGTADSDDIMLLERKRTFGFHANDMIVNGVTISFENVLAVIPMAGHPYPTYQHIGSVDATVTLSITSMSEGGLATLSNFYSMVEDQAVKFKMIPQGHRNITLWDDMVNLCGLQYFILESMTSATIPGQPGTYSISLQLTDNPLDVDTREKIAPGQSFHTRTDIRSALAEVILRHLSLEIVPSGSQSILDKISSVINASYRHYVYNPKKAEKGRDRAFEEICVKFAEEYTKLYNSMRNAMGISNYLHATATPPASAFYALKEADVPGVTRMQDDIFREIRSSSNKKPLTALSTPHNPDAARRTAELQIERARKIGLQKLQRLEEDRQAGIKYEGIFQRVAENIPYDVEDGYTNRMQNFVNEYMEDWLAFAIPFLDKVLYSGQVNLPQFREIRKKLDEMTMTSSSNCYPDFPLDTVVEILASQDNEDYSKIVEELKKAAQSGDFGLKNIGVSALIQPDFYLYNAQNDDLGSLITQKMMKAAVDGLSQAQKDARVQAEKGWLEEEYEPGVIGDKLASRVRQAAQDQQFDTVMWKSGEREQLQATLRSLIQQSRGAFHFNDLLDEAGGQGLGPSIKTEADSHEPIKVPDVGFDSFTNTPPGGMVHRDRSNVTLQSNSDHDSQAKHFFGSDSISLKANNTYAPSSPRDPNKEPIWYWPVLEDCRRITSRINPARPHPTLRNPDGSKVIRPHMGTDFASSIPKVSCAGLPALAAADGNVAFVSKSKWAKDNPDNNGGAGNSVTIQHDGGYTTKYFHLEWEGELANLSARFWKGGVKNKFAINAGETVGRIGQTGGISSGAHLHWEVHKRGADPTYQDGAALLVGGEAQFKSQGPTPAGFNDPSESLFNKSVEQFEKELSNGQGYSLMRAYPTFRLYFIESDLGERRRYQFDDFFSYSSVQEIQVIRSRKIPADLAMITLTNVSGNLTNRRFRESVDPNDPRDNNGGRASENPFAWNLTSTDQENPVGSLMLQPGVQMQLRLGYSANPDDLDTVLNGVITDVQYHETDDLLTITCQSFAVEMVQNQHGEAKSFGGFLSSTGRTGKLLEELMAMPEMVHFGRWEGGKATNTAYGVLRNEWNFVPSPQDDNIFAPSGRGIWGLFDSTAKYTLYQSTVWDVFQEMTLRHPAYVASPVPYQGKWGPRMTMFFGVPDQLYFARDPTFKEDNATSALTKFVQDSIDTLREQRDDLEELRDPNKSIGDKVDIIKSTLRIGNTAQESAKLFWLRKQTKKFALDQGYVKPFRNYHVFTSTQHIISNNISSSSNVFNTVTLQYGDDPAEVEDGELTFGELETFTLRCDAAVQDEDVKELFAQYPNCQGYEVAKRYSVGLLLYSLKENYQGSLVVIGAPAVKPHDISYIFDEYSDMFGPIEVEQVVHRFSQRHGFVTEITPDMVVHVNQNSTLSTSDAMGLMAEVALKNMGLRSLPSVQTATTSNVATGDNIVTDTALNAGSAALGLLTDITWSPIANMFYNSGEHSVGSNPSENPFGMIGCFIFRKLITRTQLAHPFRYSPLVHHGNPMVGGLPIKKNKGSFIAGIKQWAREADEGIGLMLSDVYDDIRFGNWLGKWQGDFLDSVLGR